VPPHDSVHSIQKPAAQPGVGPELKRSLTVFDGVAVLVGITIGSGIYSTPYIIAGYYGSFAGILTTWLIVGGFVLIGGLIYAELGTRLPVTGGEISRCFGPYAGFMFGWAQLFIIRTSPAAGLAIIAADYVGFFAHLDDTAHTLVALSIIAALGLFNYIGIRWAATFQNVTTVIKVVGLVGFAICAVISLGHTSNLLGSESPPTQQFGAFGNLVAALMLVVFTHAGWDRVGYVAGEMKNPRSVIPRSMFYGILIVLAIYWSVLTIYHYFLGMDGLRATPTPAAAVADVMFGPIGASLIALLAIVSAVGSINGTMMAASRVYFAMSRDGLFFRWLDFVHPTFRTPSRAVLVHCFWAAVILLIRGSFETIAAGMVFAILIFYTMTTLALFKLRRQQVGEDHSYRMPLYPWLPALYLIGVVGLLVARAILEWEKSLIDIAFVATGLPVGLYWLRAKAKVRGQAAEGVSPDSS
jgi:APA family basic amino acid/polyamine antiporter